MANDTLVRRDLAVLWHPCTQMHDHEELPPVPVRSASGVWLEDFEGRRYLDAISSWWVNLFGHRHPRIVAALEEQLARLDHVLLAGFTHEPAVALAENLLAIAPHGLAKVFYGDNGSSAIEIALKMSFHYWRNQGRAGKRRFVALRGGYHGETLGALGVTDVPLYRDTYAPLLIEPIFVDSPDAWFAEAGESPEQCALRRFADTERTLAKHADEVCAVVVEPLVQCAGGMRMHHPAYLAKLREACDRFGVHLVADEIAVGFGRTGTLFACEQAGVSPDFLCLSKGLTGGVLPLSAVLTTKAVYDAFYAEYAAQRAFLHSHSYTGNALACTAAYATLAIFRDEPVLERNARLAAAMARELDAFRDLPHVADVRQTGMIAAIELARDGDRRTPFAWQQRRGRRVHRHGLANGVLLRPLGDVVYFMPPYAITEDEIALMARVARDGIVAAVRDVD
ncbi:MAG TPA: adenosylmethionine--8-amino-7-oxononanoate transaminase [Xanthomonadales bacterium]|nr:adenosylmethionine--8-amino-7-oxononanoate transaminase [Xanthomonadales bacterium]